MRAVALLPIPALAVLWLVAGSPGDESPRSSAMTEATDGADYAERIGLGGAGAILAHADVPTADSADLGIPAHPLLEQSSSRGRDVQAGAEVWSKAAEFAPPDPLR